MQIPNCVIHLRLANDTGYGPLYLPAYFEKIIRRAFMGRLNPDADGKGIDVQPYPENGDISMRYRDVSSIAQEREILRRMYKVDKQGYVADALTDDEMKIEIEKAMLAEAKRLTNNARPVEEVTPHKSFLDAGCTKDQSLALQSAGYANRSMCIGQTIMDLNAVHGITLDLALKLIAEDKIEVKKGIVKAE